MKRGMRQQRCCIWHAKSSQANQTEQTKQAEARAEDESSWPQQPRSKRTTTAAHVEDLEALVVLDEVRAVQRDGHRQRVRHLGASVNESQITERGKLGEGQW